MPEEPEVQELSEQEKGDEEAGFGGETVAVPPKKEPERPKPEEPEGEKEEPDKEPEPEKEPTAKERAEARAAKILGAEPPAAAPKPEPERRPTEPPRAEPAKPAPTRMTKEQVAEFLTLVPEDDLPDGEIIVGNQTVNLKELATEDPDTFAAMKVMAGTIARRIAQKALEAGNLITAETFKQHTDTLRLQIAQLGFWNAIAQTHPDGQKIAATADFTAWLQTQPRGIQHLAASLDPEDGIVVLDYYKEEQAKKAATALDTKAGDKKKKKDDLHAHTTRTAAAKDTPRALKPEDLADEEAGWNEAGKQGK